MRRIDALANTPRDRLKAMTGGVLKVDYDRILQPLVEEAAKQLNMPIALASLLLDRTQFFRAQVGLPADLADARATDRDSSFCQFVVRDGKTFEVNNAPDDNRVPQELVERYGIKSYLGQPLHLGGHVIGSLCVIDVQPRSFTADEKAQLAALASRVSSRLQQLQMQGYGAVALSSAVEPAFGELRNLLAILTQSITEARQCVTDLHPVVRAVEALAPTVPEAAALTQSLTAYAGLTEVLVAAEDATHRIKPTVFALEQLLLATQARTSAAEVVSLATRLAHHQLKLVGGVDWQRGSPDLYIAASRLTAVTVLSGALVQLAHARPTKLTGSVHIDGKQVVIELTPEGLDPTVPQGVAEGLAILFDKDPLMAATVEGGRLQLRFAQLARA